MARSHGKILASIWRDEDFHQLTPRAQRAFFLLLSQSSLSLAGHIDYMPSRWSGYSVHDTAADLERDLAELVERNYIAIDTATRELLLRSFTRHDIDKGRANGNILRGMFSAWEGIMSKPLRAIVAVNMPDWLVEKAGGLVPPEFTNLRSEPEPRVRFEPELGTGTEVLVKPHMAARLQPGCPPRFEPESGSRLPLPSPSPPQSPPRTEDATTTVVDPDVSDPVTPATIDERLLAAATLLARDETQRRVTAGEVPNPEGYLRSRIDPIRRQHEPAWRALLEVNPTSSAFALAYGGSESPVPAAAPHPLDGEAAAAQARYARADEAKCEGCEGSGWIVNDDAVAVGCAACGGDEWHAGSGLVKATADA